jgi:hypothetical protein
VKKDPFKHHLRLKRPCANCPFLKVGAIELRLGRLDGIVSALAKGEHGTFHCHKTVHSDDDDDGDLDDEGVYRPSGREAMCAGAAALMMKRDSPTLMMQFAFATGAASPSDWDAVQPLIID